MSAPDRPGSWSYAPATGVDVDVEPAADAGSTPSAGVMPPTAGRRTEDLLRELLSRGEELLDAQVRLRTLLDAVVSVSADLSLQDVLRRIVQSACELSGARYGALGVIGEDRLL